MISLQELSAFGASSKARSMLLFYNSLSLDCLPAVAWSKGSNSFAYPGNTLLRDMNAPIKERRPCTVDEG